MAAKRHCFRHFHTKVTILVTISAKIVHFSVTNKKAARQPDSLL